VHQPAIFVLLAKKPILIPMAFSLTSNKSTKEKNIVNTLTMLHESPHSFIFGFGPPLTLRAKISLSVSYFSLFVLEFLAVFFHIHLGIN
jgi:hypothetical protein